MGLEYDTIMKRNSPAITRFVNQNIDISKKYEVLIASKLKTVEYCCGDIFSITKKYTSFCEYFFPSIYYQYRIIILIHFSINLLSISNHNFNSTPNLPLRCYPVWPAVLMTIYRRNSMGLKRTKSKHWAIIPDDQYPYKIWGSKLTDLDGPFFKSLEWEIKSWLEKRWSPSPPMPPPPLRVVHKIWQFKAADDYEWVLPSSYEWLRNSLLSIPGCAIY